MIDRRNAGRLAMLTGLCLLLAACTTAEELLARDRATCTAIGFPPETPEFRNCVLQLHTARLSAPRVIADYPPAFVPGPVIVAPAKPR